MLMPLLYVSPVLRFSVKLVILLELVALVLLTLFITLQIAFVTTLALLAHLAAPNTLSAFLAMYHVSLVQDQQVVTVFLALHSHIWSTIAATPSALLILIQLPVNYAMTHA